MPFGNSKYILIIEDDIDLRTALVLTLQQHGYPTLGVTHGVEAISLLCDSSKHRPSIIFTNIDMPVMDGTLFLRVLDMCSELSGIPIVIASGKELVISDKYEVLRKPYSIQDVIKLVEKYGIQTMFIDKDLPADK